MPITTEVSLETAGCIIRQSGIGREVITNICTGTVTSVPWQAFNWLAFGFVIIATFSLAAGIFWSLSRKW